MNTLEKEFIPYEQALTLKELGFDEPCFRVYDTLGFVQDEKVMDKLSLEKIQSPTFSQAFRWFREKYGLYHSIGLDNSLENDVNCDYQIINHSQSISEHETNFNNYEEAELACLKKLIEIVKNK